MPVVVNEVEVLDTPPSPAPAVTPQPHVEEEPFGERLRCAQRDLVERHRRLRAD